MLDDCSKLVRIFRKYDLFINPMQAYFIWLERSAAYNATWLIDIEEVTDINDKNQTDAIMRSIIRFTDYLIYEPYKEGYND